MDTNNTSQHHEGEISIHKRLGIHDEVARITSKFIRPAMPQQHQDFFGELPFVILGLTDSRGYPWALRLFGEPGFIRAANDTTLMLDARPNIIDLLDLDFYVGKKIGLLGIQLTSRRRNRMNGLTKEITDGSFSIQVEQSFGNCPKYIQTRDLTSNSKAVKAPKALFSSQINLSTQEFIKKSDTFFIASRSKQLDQDSRSGIDASHRGGKHGFVKVENNSLYFPDYTGNRFFNTLGNIESDWRVGLFFPDFASGGAVFISGTAEILWEHEALDSFEGAHRIIRIDVEKTASLNDYLALTGTLTETSPALKKTGTRDSPN